MNKDFLAAVENVKNLAKRPNDSTLLELYSLFKQGSEGDIQGDRPGILKIVARAKFDAWAKIKGMPQPVAQQKYIELVNQLLKS